MPAERGDGGGGSSKKGLLIGVGVVVALVVVGVVAALALGGGGGGDGGDGGDAAGVQLIEFTTEWDGTECTASWQFEGEFAAGDELWVASDGTTRAKGEALATDDIAATWRFDELSLVRDGAVVQSWNPTPAGC